MRYHYLIRFYSYCATSRDRSCAIQVNDHTKEFVREEPICEIELDGMIEDVEYHIKGKEYKRLVFARVFKLEEITFGG